MTTTYITRDAAIAALAEWTRQRTRGHETTMTDLAHEALTRVARISSDLGSELARYSVFDLESADVAGRPDRHDYRALTPEHRHLNDTTVRLILESADVVSIYVLQGDHMVRSARLTQIPSRSLAALIAAELVGDDEGAIT